MNAYHIDEMTNSVCEHLGIENDMEKATVRNAIAAYWEDKIAHVWCVEDVLVHAADEMDIYGLNERDARNILSNVEHKLDCSQGITWDVLEIYIENYHKQKYEGTFKIHTFGPNCPLCLEGYCIRENPFRIEDHDPVYGEEQLP